MHDKSSQILSLCRKQKINGKQNANRENSTSGLHSHLCNKGQRCRVRRLLQQVTVSVTEAQCYIGPVLQQHQNFWHPTTLLGLYATDETKIQTQRKKRDMCCTDILYTTKASGRINRIWRLIYHVGDPIHHHSVHALSTSIIPLIQGMETNMSQE